ncbi:MAG: DnaD domain protein [Firmicutes bacterium]|nr:DnaD domain protein [Bacillota bacterium]
MKKAATDNQTACDYAAQTLRDSRLLPMELLRRYRELDLNEKELICLLRLVSCCYGSGSMTLAQAAGEFDVTEAEAAALLRPYLDRRLLEYDPQHDCYGCDGLRRELYLLWVTRARQGEASRSDLAGLAPLPEREELRALAHLYRRFEQEMGRPLKYSESDRLRCWVEDEKIPPELLEEALKRASLRDKCTMSYIGSILRSWEKKRLTTLTMVLEQDLPEEKEAAPTPARGGKRTTKYDNVRKN